MLIGISHRETVRADWQMELSLVRGGQVNKILAFGREGCAFESFHHRQNSSFDSPLVGVDIVLKTMYIVISLVKGVIAKW